jgi:putative transposase
MPKRKTESRPLLPETLNEIRLTRGAPKFLFCDNGSEFTSQIMDLWAYHNRVRIDFSRPGKPTDNARVESFNGILQAEYLDVHRVRDAYGGQASHRGLEAGIQ